MRRIQKPVVWMMIVAMFISGGWLNFTGSIVRANSGGSNDGQSNGLLSTVQKAGLPVKTASAPDVIYVKASATSPDGDGSSWDNAFKTLYDALEETEQRASAAQPLEIWIADGLYTPDPNKVNVEERSFRMINYVTIYGGFPEDAEDGTGMSSRNWTEFQTILSGDINGDDPSFQELEDLWDAGSGDSLKYSAGLRRDNAHSVFYHPDNLGLNDTTERTIIPSFVICSLQKMWVNRLVVYLMVLNRI